jgi:hypothetical protein
LFDRTQTEVVERENWQIVRVRVRQRAVPLLAPTLLSSVKRMAGTVERHHVWASLWTDIREIVWLASIVTGLSLIGVVLAVVVAQLLAAGPALSSI